MTAVNRAPALPPHDGFSELCKHRATFLINLHTEKTLYKEKHSRGSSCPWSSEESGNMVLISRNPGRLPSMGQERRPLVRSAFLTSVLHLWWA